MTVRRSELGSVSKCLGNEKKKSFDVILEELRFSVKVIPSHSTRGGLQGLYITNLETMNILKDLV